MSEHPKVKIVPQMIKDPSMGNNEIYISSTNESVGLKVTHYVPVGGQMFSNVLPMSPSAQLQYNLSCPQNSVLSTTNSYWSYTVQFPLQCPAANAQDAVKGPYGKYIWRNGYWYFAACNNTGGLNDDGSVLPDFDKPVAICLAPMNSLCPLYKTNINYGGEVFEDLYVWRQRIFLQSLLTEQFQATMCNTWFDQNMTDIINVEVMPYKYVKETINNVDTFCKQYCTIASFIAAIKASPDDYKADGLIFNKTTNLLQYVFYKQFMIPLNLINQFFGTGNLFYISLLNNQTLIMNLYFNQYNIAQIFGTTDLFGPLCGIVNCDLVLVTKESEVAVTDEKSKDNIIKFYPKYQYQLFPTQMASSPQSVQITTMHQSVQDVLLQLYLPDDAFSQYGSGTIYQYNDSCYVKQRCTLYNVAQLLGIENGRLPYKSGEFAAGQIIPNNNGDAINPNDDYVFFWRINFNRGDESQRLYSRWFENIEQMRWEQLRSLNLLSQYDDTPPRAYYQLNTQMQKYAFFLANFEQFSMDVPNCHTFVGMDGYHSEDGMILVNFQLGRFRLSQNSQVNSVNDYNAVGYTTKSYILGDIYRVACYQFYDEKFQIQPKTSGNQISQSEEIDK